ncbi:MAG TPA: GNAT family N-acetyltransferase [Acidobacteriaceae bacterium]|jgi:N-acetylglutamate synthase-like GNAT family acetyltransferase|nr:GNAT family N-acetyltransferase [Acidobacteriaceae bacterium]
MSSPQAGDVLFRTFLPGDEAAFLRLNEAWISKDFVLESHDREILADPQTHILAHGGQICIAERNSRPVGCCALVPMAPGEFELAKMTVSEAARGHAIGRRLLEFAIAEARRMGAHRLYLESNTKAAAAVHLYEELGFRHLPAPPHPSPYARANVFMEMYLRA